MDLFWTATNKQKNSLANLTTLGPFTPSLTVKICPLLRFFSTTKVSQWTKGQIFVFLHSQNFFFFSPTFFCRTEKSQQRANFKSQNMSLDGNFVWDCHEVEVTPNWTSLKWHPDTLTFRTIRFSDKSLPHNCHEDDISSSTSTVNPTYHVF